MFITPPSLQLLVDLATPFAALLDRLNSALPALFKTLPSEFSGAYTLVLRDVRRDKYNGRVVASVEIGNVRESENVAAVMIAGGYGRPYDGRARAACVS
jgi:hypothetical protein